MFLKHGAGVGKNFPTVLWGGVIFFLRIREGEGGALFFLPIDFAEPPSPPPPPAINNERSLTVLIHNDTSSLLRAKIHLALVLRSDGKSCQNSTANITSTNFHSFRQSCNRPESCEHTWMADAF